MNINLEAAEKNAVQAYSENQVQINSITYERSLIVSQEEVISDLAIHDIQAMDEQYLQQLLQFNPEVVIIGHEQTGKFPPMSIISTLSQHRVGIECMSIGAACRTYNVLLSENREVAAGIIIP